MTITSKAADIATSFADLGAALHARIIRVGGQIVGPAFTKPVEVPFSTVPVFNAALSNVFHFATMGNNVPGATIINGSDGQTINIRTQEDGIGGWVFTVPGNVLVSNAPSTDANDINTLVITYIQANNRWEGSWVAVPN